MRETEERVTDPRLLLFGTTCIKYSAHIVRNGNCDLIYLLVHLAIFVPQRSRGLECIR